MQTKINYIILIFTLISQFVSCLDLGCIGAGKERVLYTTIYNGTYSDSDEIELNQISSYTNEVIYPEINNYLDDFEFSIDGQITRYGYGVNLFNYTGKSGISDSLKYYRTYTTSKDFYDIYPTHREYLTSKEYSITFVDSLYLQTHSKNGYYILQRNTVKDSISSKTLLEFDPFPLASNTYIQNQILNPNFDKDGNVIFISRKEIFKITSDSLQNNFFHNSFYKEAFIVRLNRDSSIDTLVQIPAGIGNYYHHLELTHSTILYSSDGIISIFDYSGNELAQLPSSGNVLANKDGNSLLNENNIYYRIDDGNTFNLNDFISNIDQAYPSSKEILVIHDSKSKISVFNVNTHSISKTIDINEMPDVDTDPNHVSHFTFESPFIFDDTLMFLYVNNYYYDDPNEPCD